MVNPEDGTHQRPSEQQVHKPTRVGTMHHSVAVLQPINQASASGCSPGAGGWKTGASTVHYPSVTGSGALALVEHPTPRFVRLPTSCLTLSTATGKELVSHLSHDAGCSADLTCLRRLAARPNACWGTMPCSACAVNYLRQVLQHTVALRKRGVSWFCPLTVAGICRYQPAS